MNKEVKHCANDALLMGYAAGVLPEAFDLVIASHLALSDQRRARSRPWTHTGPSRDGVRVTQLRHEFMCPCDQRIELFVGKGWIVKIPFCCRSIKPFSSKSEADLKRPETLCR